MTLGKLWWLGPVVWLLACPPHVRGTCANEVCTAEQRCDADTLHCVTDEPPELTVDAPSALITQPKFVVTGKVTDDGAAATVDWRLGDSAEFTALTTEEDGTFTVTIDTPALDDQTVVLEVRARDARSQVSVERTIAVDVVAPTLVVDSPAANTLVTTLGVDAAVTTSAGTVEVLVSSGGTELPMEGGPTSWTLSQLPLGARDDSMGVLRFVARDAAGNTTTVEHPIGVDNVAPQVRITSPIADSLHRGPFTISAIVSPGVSVTYSYDGGSGPMTGVGTVWTASSVAVPQQDHAPLTVRVTAQDFAGNIGFAEVTIFVDTVAPVITFTAPAADQKFKASDFAATSSVTTAWTIADADPMAGTTTVNGAPSTALDVAVPTGATDNPTSYTTTVVAADRAGNMATATRTYSVDRVSPTVVSWTPASGRMLDSPDIVITFSEPVFGATTDAPALVPGTNLQPAGTTWSLNHTRFTLPSTWKGQSMDVKVPAGLADEHGNPVAAATRYYHVATSIPSGTLLASNVSTFSATSDNDGELRAMYLTTAGAPHFLLDLAGSVTDIPLPGPGSRVSVNAWNTVDPVTLASSPTWGGSIYDATAPANAQYSHIMGPHLAATRIRGAVVSVPPLNREPATEPYALVVQNEYQRGTFTRTFNTYADMVTAQSADSWIVASYSGSQVRWSRYRCNRDTQLFPGPATYSCEGTEYGGALGSLTIDSLEAVMTRSGNCLLINAGAPHPDGSRYNGGWAQRLENCDGALGVSPPASCYPNTSLPTQSGAAFGQRFAPFSANGEDTIIVAYPAGTGNPSEFRLERMLPGTCGFLTTQTPRITVPNVREYQPVQIGNKAAFIYVNTSNELRVFVP